jgi:hypothetical protein
VPEDEDGEKQVAGWVKVLTEQVVGYVPDRTGVGAATYTFESLDSAEWVLGYSGIYPVQDRATVPHAIDWATHH